MSLQDLLKNIPFLSKESPSVLGIDIGSSSIKVVQLKKKGGHAVLETYGEIALGPYAGSPIGRATNLTADRISQALADVIRESKVTTKDCGVSIPLSSSLIKFIKIPVINEKQLAQMVPIEARKYIPVPISEVLLDWTVIPKEDQIVMPLNQNEAITDNGPKAADMTDVLLVVIHNDAIMKTKTVLSTANVSSSFYEIETFATMRSTLDQGIVPIIIMDIGAASTKLYISERGVLRTSHIINRGGQDITSALATSTGQSIEYAENLKRTIGLLGLTSDPKNKQISEIISLNMDYIFSETNRAILNYQRSANKIINRMVLTGGGSSLKGLADLASQTLGVKAELANPFAKVQAPAFMTGVLAETGPEFSCAVGLAIRRLQELL